MANRGFAASYFRLGLDFYIAGRYSASAGLVLVSLSQLHHAVEMFLLARFEQHAGESLHNEMTHSLQNLWRIFKRSVADPSLGRFDETVTALHHFETVRYPKDLNKSERAVIFKWSEEDTAQPSELPFANPEHNLSMAAIDRFVYTLIGFAPIKLDIFTSGMSTHAKQFLVLGNVFISGDPPTLAYENRGR